MALREIELQKIKVDYEAGKLSQRKIAAKHGISRNTLSKHAKKNKWIFATNEPELSQKIERLTYEKLIEDEVDRAATITNQFLSDVDKYRKLAMIPASELAKAYTESQKGKTKITKEEFSRIWEGAKAIKTSLEGLNIGYSGARKALGMDRDEDIRKAKELKQAEQAQEINDPLKGITEEELDAELKKLDD